MVLFSSSKYKEVGQSFFGKFDFINTYGEEVNIDNKGEKDFSYCPKETNIRPIFGLVDK